MKTAGFGVPMNESGTDGTGIKLLTLRLTGLSAFRSGHEVVFSLLAACVCERDAESPIAGIPAMKQSGLAIVLVVLNVSDIMQWYVLNNFL